MQTQMNTRSEMPIHISQIINENDLVYVSNVLSLCKEMESNEVRSMDKSHPNYQRFVNALKSIMNAKLDRTFGFEIEFNPDYSKFKKIPECANVKEEIKTT